MNTKDTNAFFNLLRLDGGAIWLENETIRLSTSKKLQNAETRNFVVDHQLQIISVLNENSIFSKEKFITVLIFKDNSSNAYPLSPAQERLWFIEQYEQGSNAYHIPVIFEFDASTNIKGIKHALQQIISRHEVLRSTIEQGENEEHGIQRIHNEPLLIEEVKLQSKQAYKSLIKKDIKRPFNLSIEYPVRIKVYTVPSKKAVSGIILKSIFLLVNIHHIAGDGWSVEIFKKELIAYYEAFITKSKDFHLPALEIQYKDYAIWQRAYLSGPVLEEQLMFWKKKLLGYQTLEIPVDFGRPIQVDYKGSYESFVIDKESSQALRTLAKLYSTTLHSVLLSSVNILLNKYTGQDDIVIGSPIANRHHRQTEDLIGFFVNMQVNRTRLSHSQNFEELIQQVHREQVQAQLHQDLPFEKLVDELGVERDPSRHPVFQVTFGVQSFDNRRSRIKQRFSVKSFQTAGFYEIEKFDLSINIDDSRQELLGHISYATALFRKATIQRLIGHYTYLLHQLIAAPEQSYSNLSLLSPQEYQQIVCEWNTVNKKYIKDKTIDQLFQKQVEKTPGNIALMYKEQLLTYQQLNEKSNQLARYVRTQYEKSIKEMPGPDFLIALHLDRGMEMIIGILAVLKAGGAYVPIDVTYPQERIDYILQDTGAQLILSKRQLAKITNAKFPENKVIFIDLSEDFYNTEDGSNLPLYSNATDLAYVMYTSGSTGKPKGVMIEQGCVINLVFSQTPVIQINFRSKIIQFASYLFDASVWEVFSALLHGAQLFIIPVEIKQDAQLLCNYLEKNKITIALLPPALLNMMPYTRLPYLKTLLVGGDISVLEIINKWSPGRKLINAYGPTENTVITTMHTYESGDKNTNIGKPIPNTSVYVLDRNLNPVPIGVTGELYIGGDGLARGYLNNPHLTAQRFINNPFAAETDESNARLYRTGDLVRWLADGNLQFMGRNDNQVKIRGFRIELGEVEHALSMMAGIKQNCVLAKERKTAAGSDKFLVAYYILDNSNDTLTQSAIIKFLSQVLPDYMVPGAYVQLASMPFTINGKLDRQALPDPDLNSPQETYVAPTNEREAAVCSIWQELLGLKKVGITDNFFRIGGNSILAIQVSHRMSRTLGWDVFVADVFRLKSIDKIVAAQNQSFELVRPYHIAENNSLNNMLFIHPGHGDSEVYQHLADLLSSEYNCIGIDNYNLHYKDKIGSLDKLAFYYLSAYEKKYPINEPVNLLGWSLGGLIALEIASILERKGFKNINVFLLDTFIINESALNPRKQKSSRNPVNTHTMPAKYDLVYFEKIASAFGTEKDLACSSISSYLKHTQVILFKATQREKHSGLNNKNSDFADQEFKKLTANNINLVSKNVDVIDLNCYHGNMLDTNSVTISCYILSKKASDSLKKIKQKSVI